VFTDHVVENIPDNRFFALHHFLGGLDGCRQAAGFQLGENKRLEQLQRHALGQTALMQTQGRTHHDHRTTGVVNALTQQVLTETTLLALDHVGQGLQRALVGAGDGAAATTVVEQGINGFLQHALFVAHDDIGSVELQQALETVVAVDHPAVQIVQIRGGKTTTVEGHQRAQVRRQHRQGFKNHPLGLVTRQVECFQQLEALGKLLALGLGVGIGQFFADIGDFALKVDIPQQRLDGFGAHAGAEFIAIFFHSLEVLLIIEQLTALEGGHTGIGNHKGFEIQNPLDFAQGHVQQQPDTGRQGFQEPDVRHRAGQFNVAHALAPHLGECHFHATFLADNAAMLHALVLAAQALVVAHRAKNLGTEQAFALWLEGTVIDGFRFFDFAK